MEFKNESFTESLNAGRAFYKAIRQTWCPALNDFIFFRKDGFQHLIGKGSAVRPKSEQKRRFSLLPYVPKILNDPDSRFIHKIKIIRGRHIYYWIFTMITDGMHINVIIRQNPHGKKHFLSVYGKKQKSTH
jgi:hypothetical protein